MTKEEELGKTRREPRLSICVRMLQRPRTVFTAHFRLDLPKEHHRQIRSTNPLERLNKEIKHRTEVGIFPNDDSALRLLGAVMMEQNDEWIVLRRYFSQESMSKLLPPTDATMALPPVD